MKNEFSTEESLNKNIQTFVIGNWGIRVSPKEIVISENEKSQLESMALFWAKSFNPNHKNWMVENFSVPSNIIRFDYVLDYKGDINVFEIEDRPAGFEINALVSRNTNNSFMLALDRLSTCAQKPIGICISKGRMFNSDDFFWAQRLLEFNRNWDFKNIRIVFGEVPKNPEDYLWFVRSLRHEKEYYDLEKYSFSTIQYEGDKSYGLKMGLYKTIPEDILWDKPFVFKPESGCRCENVHMYHPKQPGGGFSTRSKIERAIENGDVKYIQPYYEPEHPDFLPNGYSMLRRCYLIFDIQTLSYKVVGGQWEARPKCHKIHGASDAVCGNLTT
jgi:hypothetical protein